MNATMIAGVGSQVSGVRAAGSGFLCVWRSPHTPSSGVGIVYVHSGALQAVDADPGTRDVLSHLTGEGHVIVEVTHPTPQAPDADGSARQAAVHWLEAHRRELAVQPGCTMVWTRT